MAVAHAVVGETGGGARPVQSINRGGHTMKRFLSVAAGLLVVAMIVTGCAHGLRGGWTSLIVGDKGLENFNRVGDANWRAEGGVIVADKGKGGHLVTTKSYK